MTAIGDALGAIGEGILNLPSAIVNVFVDLFTVEDDYFTSKFESYKIQLLSKFNTNPNELAALQNIQEKDIVSISGKWKNKSVTFVNFDAWQQYKDVFRGWINGFFAILLVFYNCNQVLFLIRGTYLFNSSKVDSKSEG